jgi:hypothetical protein
MKTTLNLDDELICREAAAAERGSTLTALVETALRAVYSNARRDIREVHA